MPYPANSLGSNRQKMMTFALFDGEVEKNNGADTARKQADNSGVMGGKMARAKPVIMLALRSKTSGSFPGWRWSDKEFVRIFVGRLDKTKTSMQVIRSLYTGLGAQVSSP